MRSVCRNPHCILIKEKEKKDCILSEILISQENEEDSNPDIYRVSAMVHRIILCCGRPGTTISGQNAKRVSKSKFIKPEMGRYIRTRGKRKTIAF